MSSQPQTANLHMHANSLEVCIRVTYGGLTCHSCKLCSLFLSSELTSFWAGFCSFSITLNVAQCRCCQSHLPWDVPVVWKRACPCEKRTLCSSCPPVCSTGKVHKHSALAYQPCGSMIPMLSCPSCRSMCETAKIQQLTRNSSGLP